MGKNTIRRQTDFDRIFAQGRRFRGRLLTAVVARHETDAGVMRAAFVVGRKVSKLAVRRNQIRRRMREALRSLIPERPTGWDVVIIASPAAVRADYWGLRAALGELLRAAGLMRDDPGG